MWVLDHLQKNWEILLKNMKIKFSWALPFIQLLCLFAVHFSALLKLCCLSREQYLALLSANQGLSFATAGVPQSSAPRCFAEGYAQTQASHRKALLRRRSAGVPQSSAPRCFAEGYAQTQASLALRAAVRWGLLSNKEDLEVIPPVLAVNKSPALLFSSKFIFELKEKKQ
jgi:hypothetical protein